MAAGAGFKWEISVRESGARSPSNESREVLKWGIPLETNCSCKKTWPELREFGKPRAGLLKNNCMCGLPGTVLKCSPASATLTCAHGMPHCGHLGHTWDSEALCDRRGRGQKNDVLVLRPVGSSISYIL